MDLNYSKLEQFIRFPVINSELIERKRLLDLIESNFKKKLILLSAPAGYGKTSLISQYISFSSDQRIIYLNGSEKLTSPFEVLKIIYYGLSKLTENIDHNVFEILNEYIKSGADEPGILEHSLEMIIKYFLLNHNSRYFLIIDDFHLIDRNNDSNKTGRILARLLKENLDNLTILISGRENPSFDVSYLKAKRLIYIIGQNELKFNKNETLEISSKFYNLTISNDALLDLENKFNGWIAVLHLIFQKGKNWANQIDKIKSEDIFPYLANDIVSEWDLKITEFINKTSVLDYFTAEEADFLLESNFSEHIINLLKNKNVFIETNIDSKGNEFYTYSKIFLDYLRNNFNSKTEVKSVCRKAALIYKSRNNFPEYLRYSLLSGDTQIIIPEFSLKCIYYICTNNFSEYDNCINILSLHYNDPDYTLMNVIRLNIFKGKNVKLPHFNNYFKQQFSRDYSLLAAEYYLSVNLYKDSLKILKNIPIDNEDFIIQIYTEFLKARTYYRMGEEFYGNTAEICNLLIEKELPDFIWKDVLLLLANVYNNTGKPDTAIHYYEKSLNYSTSFLSNIKTLGNLIDLYSMTGNYEKAFLHLSELIRNAEGYNIPSIASVTLRAQINFCRNIGDFNTAIVLLFKTIDIEDISKNDLLIAVKYLEISQAYYDSGNINKSNEIFELACSHYKKCEPIELFDILFNYFTHLINHDKYDHEKSGNVILETIEWHKKKNILKPLGIFYFHLSLLKIKTNNFSIAHVYIKESFNNLKRQMNNSFLENCIIRSRIVFDYAISENIDKKMIRDIASSLFTKYQLNFLNDEFKKYYTEEINRLLDLQFLPFGKAEIFLRGERISEDKWIRKKSKILLVYLMSDPNQIHTKDEIMDIFFDDMPADKADVAYHSTIYNIRSALKIYDIKSDKPKRSKDKTYDYNPQYILYEDKSLRLNPDFYYTSENVEFEKLYNKTKLPSLSVEEKITHSVKAIELYKGDFLPGYYDSWCEELRVKYKNMFITLCEELIKFLEAEIRLVEVIKYTEFLLKEDKLNDSAHISIINAYTMLGNNSMAKSRFELMLKIYDEELGEKPHRRTLEKIKLILSTAKDP